MDSKVSEAVAERDRVFGGTEARKAWIIAEQELLEQYVDEYEMCCDDGYYGPTEHERKLLLDALQGFVVEHDKLLAGHLAEREALSRRATGDDVGRLIRAAQPFADSIVFDPGKQRGDRHWATFGSQTNIEQVRELQAALAALKQGEPK